MKLQTSGQLPKIFLIVSIFVVAVAYQNCGGGFKSLDQGALMASLGSGPWNLVPPSDKFDETCQTNGAYDACVIQQNPLVKGSALTGDASQRIQQVGTVAKYGVKLPSVLAGGYLENATISVHSLKSPRAKVSAADLKVPITATNVSMLEQVNAFYWINRTAEYFDSRTKGLLPAMGKNIKVIVDDSVTGYDAAKNTIRLKHGEENSVSYNGDVAIHLFGVANLMLANPSGWTTLATEKHLTCNLTYNGCCKSASGCASAIRFGVGDYFAASMFPERTRIGEGIANSGNPQVIQGINRDIASLAETSASSAFTTANGSVQALGLVYSSIWWEVRKLAGKKIDEVDRIFLEHLVLLDGKDDFHSAIEKAKTVDKRLFEGRYSVSFDQQLAARGL